MSQAKDVQIGPKAAAIVILAISVTQGDIEMVVGQLIYSISLLALLFGNAGPIRMGVDLMGLKSSRVQVDCPTHRRVPKHILANLGPDDPRNSEAIVFCLYESERVYIRGGACLSLGGRF